MAARTRKITLSDEWKEKIRISHIINRLSQSFDGELELTADQIRIADMLLKKVVPDLARVDGTMEHSGEIDIINVVKKLDGQSSGLPKIE